MWVCRRAVPGTACLRLPHGKLRRFPSAKLVQTLLQMHRWLAWRWAGLLPLVALPLVRHLALGPIAMPACHLLLEHV